MTTRVERERAQAAKRLVVAETLDEIERQLACVEGLPKLHRLHEHAVWKPSLAVVQYKDKVLADLIRLLRPEAARLHHDACLSVRPEKYRPEAGTECGPVWLRVKSPDRRVIATWWTSVLPVGLVRVENDLPVEWAGDLETAATSDRCGHVQRVDSTFSIHPRFGAHHVYRMYSQENRAAEFTVVFRPSILPV